MPNTVTDAKNLVDDVSAKREDDFNTKFPELNRDNYETDEAYRGAMTSQYLDMRREQYNNTCLAAGIEGYDVSLQCNMNVDIWKQVKPEITDSIYGYAPNVLPASCKQFGDHRTTVVKNGVQKTKVGEFCCAASANTIEYGICKRMGTEGLIKNDPRNTGAANLASFDSEHKVSGKGSQNLWKQIDEGQVGPGDQISRQSSGNTVSGRHAELIVAVNRDETGKLKSFVVQGNNSANLQVVTSASQYPPMQTVTSKDKNGKAVKSKVPCTYTVGCMNKWMEEQFQKEASNMQSLTTEQMQEKIVEQKTANSKSMEELKKNEKCLFEHHPLDYKVQKYADWYVKNADIPDATTAVMKADQSNATELSDKKAEETRQATQQVATQEQTQQQTDLQKLIDVKESTSKEFNPHTSYFKEQMQKNNGNTNTSAQNSQRPLNAYIIAQHQQGRA